MLDWLQQTPGATPAPGGDDVIDINTSKVTAGFTSLVLLSTILGNLAQVLNPWYTNDSLIAISLGFLASLPLCGENYSSIHGSFDTVFFLFLVPPILFEAGFALNQKDFFKNFAAICTLAVCGTLLSTFILGLGLFFLAKENYIKGINGQNPKEGLLFGSMMSATDPIGTLAVMGSLDVDTQLYSIVFGESVINDAVAVVLFQTFLSLPDGNDISISSSQALDAFVNFLIVSIGSVVVGALFGMLSAFITKRVIKDGAPHSEVTIVLSVAYLSFIFADAIKVSGLMSIFFCGVIMSHYTKYNLSNKQVGEESNGRKAKSGRTEVCLGLVLRGLVNRALFDIKSERVFLVLVAQYLQELTIVMFNRGAIAFALSLTFQGPNRTYIIPCVVVIILFTNVFLGQLTAPVLRLLKIPTFVSQDHGANVSSSIMRVMCNAISLPPPAMLPATGAVRTRRFLPSANHKVAPQLVELRVMGCERMQRLDLSPYRLAHHVST
ncbi:hypothetical protein GUITHDRAFT_117819 [Guillardia theta CCMP2712]|uniref:Cation/H+ exchanger transmembrane domain-containing protein n=1 Tax=Guillardia theta (strain CCMP2712) TaxID=905079 RepID=L1IJP1_GUITC|nr:hypothetical protein GUITHDRAFT_117819 [Guillardia theta CCMP2712]EKX36030.1 hypothetical protein GUITHDRAFT_117819 [Guillardia theta CCMP2712]|eukprot:XP_005823010.1 hypothetical protein GUITHDRAFT_117819 [Guillardia theta CCMP2712]